MVLWSSDGALGVRDFASLEMLSDCPQSVRGLVSKWNPINMCGVEDDLLTSANKLSNAPELSFTLQINFHSPHICILVVVPQEVSVKPKVCLNLQKCIRTEHC